MRFSSKGFEVHPSAALNQLTKRHVVFNINCLPSTHAIIRDEMVGICPDTDGFNQKVSELITQTCEKTRYKDLCISTLETFAGSNQDDLPGLAKRALKVTSLHGGEVHDKLIAFYNQTEDESVRQCLTDCSENYQDAIDQLEDSLAALDAKNYNDLNLWTSAAMADAELCEEGFKDRDDIKSPITEINEAFKQMCTICLDIIKELAK
ncbi:hypothetical protein K2173_025910 [Erythroxylum novogranatense]|uniref:Pectinesterase inhibitor domain-containing protein n=1 Tax=Erythroxylum novogranatense TaxID=1862640 RepID=A0AAV8TWC8_9ROSI|nr:hypothetical protein K2173_025910 [Erythroxylum novogranatense]